MTTRVWKMKIAMIGSRYKLDMLKSTIQLAYGVRRAAPYPRPIITLSNRFGSHLGNVRCTGNITSIKAELQPIENHNGLFYIEIETESAAVPEIKVWNLIAERLNLTGISYEAEELTYKKLQHYDKHGIYGYKWLLTGLIPEVLEGYPHNVMNVDSYYEDYEELLSHLNEYNNGSGYSNIQDALYVISKSFDNKYGHYLRVVTSEVNHPSDNY